MLSCMFKTKEDLAKSLSEITYEDEEITETHQKRQGILRAVLGATKTIKEATYSQKKFSSELVDALVSHARPGFQLVGEMYEHGQAPIGVTKIGGLPDLPPDLDWPSRPPNMELAESERRVAEGLEDKKFRSVSKKDLKNIRKNALTTSEFYAQPSPLTFIAQINFADFAKSGANEIDPGMPQSGMLYVFYDFDAMPWGFDPKDRAGFSLIWHDGEQQHLKKRERPPTLPGSDIFEFSPRVLRGESGWFARHHWDDGFDLKLNDAQYDGYFEWLDETAISKPDHRLLASPYIIQNPMEAECALVAAGKYCGNGDAYRDQANADIVASAKDWILLAQIDTDDDVGVMWGDCGMLYIWIRKQDLSERAFENAHIVLQCY